MAPSTTTTAASPARTAPHSPPTNTGTPRKAARNSSGHPQNQQAKSRRRTLVVLVLPSVLLLLLINAYPLVYATFQSLRNGTLINTGDFVGLDNYTSVLTDPAFWEAVRFTAVFTALAVLGSWAVGLALALVLRSDFPGRGVFKILLMLPWVVPVVVSAMSWNQLLTTPQSLVPRVFDLLGLGSPLLLADPALAKVTIILFEVWLNFPFMMLMISGALASVDHSVYEAARMDGASSRQQFFHITLPLIARPTYISWILMTIFIVNDFPTVYLLTGGGPESSTTTLVVLAYRAVFQNFQVGQGVAIAFLMSFALVVISTVLYRQVRKAHV
ncbi:carbohydrate ABC transporter permease [Streptomyces sp. NEAU-YJ-81]|uniref:carbohydrate ABC transporter permease n=1 Tax=Streptomyces sp. NEAU-YJ-81 TaxID=2820288 RepID=UPI001ABCECC9|nr:sugar ABC transporter permease [Streptomyces sp. NEAU-YJ-81]MBO3682133.1 sugar ABC transporter permease [Streptomyces sp. NEAU-YJ-81]